MVGEIREELEREKEIVSRVQEELETSRAGGGGDGEETSRLEQRLQEVEESRKNMEQVSSPCGCAHT